MKIVALLLLGLALGTPADAAAQGAVPLMVEVGQTVAYEVGLARGAQCDDPALVRAEVRAYRPDSNLFVVTGLTPGKTLCRAGTDAFRPHVLFEITVVEPAAPPPR